MSTNTLAWQVEKVCLDAWPSLQSEVVGDWCLRYADGLTRRANSANPLQEHTKDIEATVRECKQRYRLRGHPTIFRIPTLIHPSIEKSLLKRGYGIEGESIVLHEHLNGAAVDDDQEVEIVETPTDNWCGSMAALQSHSKETAAIYRQIVASIEFPTAFASLNEGERVVSQAYGTLQDDLLCIESVITDSGYRQRGFAKKVLSSLFLWGLKKGATGVCLQVEADNSPAITLYRKLGLDTELYQYHYLREPIAS